MFFYRGFAFFYDAGRLAYLLYSIDLDIEALEIPMIPGILPSLVDEYNFVSFQIDSLIESRSVPF